MSENIKQNIVGSRSNSHYKNNGRQPFNNQTDRITPFTASDICDGDLPGRKTLRFHRKVHQ